MSASRTSEREQEQTLDDFRLPPRDSSHITRSSSSFSGSALVRTNHANTQFGHSDSSLTVAGPRGSLQRDIQQRSNERHAEEYAKRYSGNALGALPAHSSSRTRSCHGSVASEEDSFDDVLDELVLPPRADSHDLVLPPRVASLPPRLPRPSLRALPSHL